MFFTIKLSVKNKVSLNNFNNFLKNNEISYSYRLLKRTGQKKTILTTLKSPHVNKTAQEHFEIRKINQAVFKASLQFFKEFLHLKKSKEKVYSDIASRVEITFNNKTLENVKTKMLNPDLFQIPIAGNDGFKKETCILKYIQLLDSYGEITLQLNGY